MFKFVLVKYNYEIVQQSKFTLKYFKKITFIKYVFSETNKREPLRNLLTSTKKFRIKALSRFAYCYRVVFHTLRINILNILKFFKTQNKERYNNLLLNFNHNKVNATVQSLKKKNLTNVTAGLFLKFFENQKNKKKSKLIKMLIAKYLRKIFIVSKLKYLNVVISHNPVDLISFFNTLNSPIIAPFQDPYNEELIEESSLNKFSIRFNYFIFKQAIPYHKKKIKKRGRIKRKILRKLVIENKLVD
jgi:hypothetical protein